MANIDSLIENISNSNIQSFFVSLIGNFKPEKEEFSDVLKTNEPFGVPQKIGQAELNRHEELLVFSCEYKGALNERSARKRQFEIAKKVLKEDFKDGAIFIFYDKEGSFRFSFIRRNYGEVGNKKYTPWKRYTYLVNPDETNKTFKDRIGHCNFDSLDNIQEAFSVAKLTKEFYNELFDWYEWVLTDKVGATFPNLLVLEKKERRKQFEEQIIRLITRLLFVWFIKQKNLAPDNLFNEVELSKYLKNFDSKSDKSGNYYNAILQNLFFATLNKAVNERTFATNEGYREIKSKYRYAEMFNITEKEILDLFHKIPFLNGGLFECLDKEKGTDGIKYHLDGFSRNDTRTKDGKFKHRAFIPNNVFFDEEKGIIPLFKRYNFTVEENAPNEVQVALDPELLGKVFENLLGAFNPETQKSARSKSGSFYTPRDIVDYMVKESLFEYFKKNLPETDDILIRDLLSQEELPTAFQNNKQLRAQFAATLRKIKILDPACGSGAFPMGILKQIVEILERLEPDKDQTHYDLKLHLIEECIFGVDIQPIATQISRLRFFISLIVEQENIDFNRPEDNYGILTLPNLETKFVAANTLIGLEKQEEGLLDLADETLKDLKKELMETRHSHFYAKSTSQKVRLREKDEEIREKIKEYLTENSTKPNEQTIQNAEKRIEKLLKERLKVQDENWVDDTEKAVQSSLFGEESQNPSLFKKDLNKIPRDKIDKEIKGLKKTIAQEKKKAQAIGLDKEIANLTQWNPYNQNEHSPFFDMKWMFGMENGFDIVIGNPPYISTKDVNASLKKELKKEYGFADDTYSHFFFKGDKLLKENGVISYITSKTFWTIQTKRNLRDLILAKDVKYLFDTANPFEAVMVDTCITSFKKADGQPDNKIRFLDGSKDLTQPELFSIPQSSYLNAQNKVIFKPTELNLKIQELYGDKIKELYDKWWPKINTSRKIAQNKEELEAYRNSLKPGDIALLGCLTEGGQGLATGNNGKYIAVRRSTKWAGKIVTSRPQKLAKAIENYNIKIEALSGFANEKEFLESLTENEIIELFDELKEKYGRDIFGQGYLFRIVEDEDIADVDLLTDDEKENGIDLSKKYYVPYDKGDKDGNRWFLETPFAIAWTKENVRFLKTDPKARYQGYLYYFREGFCWSDINTTYLKCRKKLKTVNDVKSMSLYPLAEEVPVFYIVSLINSAFFSHFVDDFVNNTQTFQINDARQLPIVIPSEDDMKIFDKIFENAFEIKQEYFNNRITKKESKSQLQKVQKTLDEQVEILYNLI